MTLSKKELHYRKTYWTLVKCCLIQFYGWEEIKATKAIKNFWKRIPLEGNSMISQLVYHQEPISTASDWGEGGYKNKFKIEETAVNSGEYDKLSNLVQIVA